MLSPHALRPGELGAGELGAGSRGGEGSPSHREPPSPPLPGEKVMVVVVGDSRWWLCDDDR